MKDILAKENRGQTKNSSVETNGTQNTYSGETFPSSRDAISSCVKSPKRRTFYLKFIHFLLSSTSHIHCLNDVSDNGPDRDDNLKDDEDNFPASELHAIALLELFAVVSFW